MNAFHCADGTRTIIDIEADGNCLFRSISDQLYHDFGSNHGEVRDEVCNFLAGHKDDFSLFLVLDDEDAAANEEDASDFETYVFNMREDGDWGGHLELVAAARMYRYVTDFASLVVLFICALSVAHVCLCVYFTFVHVGTTFFRRCGCCSCSRNITVYSAHLDAYTIEHGSDKKAAGPDLLLSYHDNDHYNSVRTCSGSKPPPPIKTYVAPRPPPMQHEHAASHDEETEMMVEETTSTTNTSAASSETDVDMSEKATPPPPSEPTKKNSPCPCESGLRYKKCCAAKLKHAARVKKLPQGNDSSAAKSTRGSDEPTMDGNFRVLRI